MKTITCWCMICALVLFENFVYAQTDVLTQHNDLKRTGWNQQETILTQANVNSNSFGKLFVRPVDDQIYAQPLVVSGVNIPSVGSRNVVYVATVNNSIYAFNADSSAVTNPYWKINLTRSGYRVPNRADIHPQLCGFYYSDFTGNFGIVGTPVIDKTNGILYVVTRDVSTSGIDQGPHPNPAENNNDVDTAYSSVGFHQFLHAINITTGQEMLGGPVEIKATAASTGDGSYNGQVSFDPRRNVQRCGLVLSNGMIYIAYAAHCDWGNYHGWLLGYNASNLHQQIVYITTPNDGRGGIWMSGAAPAVDDNGSIYFSTGNGHIGTNTSPGYTADADYAANSTNSPAVTVNRGESVVKLTPNTLNNAATSVNISSYFTPNFYNYYNDADLDFPIQVLLIPNTNMAVSGCKDNNLYVMDRTNGLGGFNANSNNVLQTINVGSNAQMHSSLAYFGGSGTQYLYQLSENTLLKAFPVSGNSLGTPVNSGIQGPTGSTGAFMSVSSNGTDPNSAILWISQATPNCNANASVCSGILRAVKANDVTTELWNSTLNTADNVGTFAKMNCPTIANGKVYLGSFSNLLYVYGPKQVICTNNNNVALNQAATASSTSGSNAASKAFDGNITGSSYWSSSTAGSEYLQVDLGQPYSICKIVITWVAGDYGTNFDMQISSDGTNWTTVQQVRNNTAVIDTIGSFTLTARYVRMQGINGAGSNYSVYEMGVYGQAANTCTAPSGLTSASVDQNSTTLNWQASAGATGGYIIQYKTPVVSSWTTKTSSTNSITLTALTCGANYNYRVQSVCASGTSDSTVGSFTTSNCSNPCTLPTRYNHADIGDIGVAGSSCFNSTTGVFTLKGSGANIGGTSDAFQFAFTTLAGDEYISAQVLSMDASSPSNKVGIMMRDSVSLTSPFAFIGLTSGTGIVFEYRTTSGGPTTTINQAGHTYPYWVKLQKTGTQYSAYISADNVTWTQVGATVDLGFGSTSVYPGLAVTSANNSVLSTATVGSYFESGSVPLIVNLTSFTASNINNTYISLQWVTSQEKDNDYFEVQRSSDGINFQPVTTVKGYGNSDVPRFYTAEDNNPAEGINFYRLKQVDIEQQFTYSNVVPVNFGRQATPMVFPNPATSYVTILAGQEAMKEINIYNVAGKIVKSVINGNGASAITISSQNLPAGIYIVQIRTAGKVYQQKLIRE